MNDVRDNVIRAIKEAVVTVPGVASFANFHEQKGDDQLVLKTSKIEDAVEIFNNADIARYRIHVILISGVNIKDVINEIQIRVKYELEKNSKFANKYQVDIVADDITSN